MSYFRASKTVSGGGGVNYSHTIITIPNGTTTYANVQTQNGFAVTCNDSSNLAYGDNIRNWAVIGNGNILDSYSLNANASIGYDASTHKVYATNNVTAVSSIYLHIWTIN